MTATVSFRCPRESRLLLFLLECNVEHQLHKVLWFMIPYCFIQRGSLCLSWFLEPSLSIKANLFLFFSSSFFFWPYVKKAMSLWSDPLVLWHQNDVCCCIYHQAFYCCYQLLFFSFFSFFVILFWGICFVELACFTFLWLLFGNKILQKNSSHGCVLNGGFMGFSH